MSFTDMFLEEASQQETEEKLSTEKILLPVSWYNINIQEAEIVDDVSEKIRAKSSELVIQGKQNQWSTLTDEPMMADNWSTAAATYFRMVLKVEVLSDTARALMETSEVIRTINIFLAMKWRFDSDKNLFLPAGLDPRRNIPLGLLKEATQVERALPEEFLGMECAAFVKHRADKTDPTEIREQWGDKFAPVLEEDEV